MKSSPGWEPYDPCANQRNSVQRADYGTDVLEDHLYRIFVFIRQDNISWTRWKRFVYSISYSRLYWPLLCSGITIQERASQDFRVFFYVIGIIFCIFLFYRMIRYPMDEMNWG